MEICELYYSIQGEGKWSGYPTVFVRAARCNLRCSFCDTKYAYLPGKKMDNEEIIKKVKAFRTRYVCITGGEPLLQRETIDLLDLLLKEKFRVVLETNGSIDIEEAVEKFSGYGENLLISLDIKCPSSGMHERMKLDNIEKLRDVDQLKFVIMDREDYEYAKNLIGEFKPKSEIFFQPVWGTDPKKLARWLMEDALDARLSLQIHKIIWGERRGV
ncbi:MAG: 7-carboxy-7-deazaguanine synthase QueE [Thermoplasmata archaeon]|nr:MAG: 7-carboxy-7-deazaguanine synthase QueE [Thermoplasmata archaeon]